MKTFISFTIEHWVAISALLAAALRLIPTEKNYDIASKILRLLDLIIPNLKKGGGRHVAKLVLFFVLVSVCGESYGQLNVRARQLRFATGVQHAADTAETSANKGRVWYDFDTERFRKNEDGTNSFLVGSGGGGGGGGGGSWSLANGGALTGDNDITGTNYLKFTLDNFSDWTQALNLNGSVDMSVTDNGSGENSSLTLNPTAFNLQSNSVGVSVSGGNLTLQGDVDLAPSTTASELYFAQYTPTLTPVLNVASTTAFAVQYFRVGNMVTIFGTAHATPTAGGNTDTSFAMNLPISSNFTLVGDAGGTAAPVNYNLAAAVIADSTNDRLIFRFLSPGTTVINFFFHVSYIIK